MAILFQVRTVATVSAPHLPKYAWLELAAVTEGFTPFFGAVPDVGPLRMRIAPWAVGVSVSHSLCIILF